MAITFHQIPDSITSGYDPMNFVVSSGASHNTEFRFNSQLKDSSGNIIKTFIHIKQPTYGNLLFDAHRTIENYLSYDIDNLIGQVTGWQTGVNVFKKFTLTVIEEYPRLTFHASGTSNAVIAVNSAMDWQDYVNFNLGGRYASNSTRKWMTNQPTRIKIRENDSYELGAIVNAIDTIKYLKVLTYDAAGSLLKTAIIDYTGVAISTDAMKFPSILVGPSDLNASTLTTGTQDLIEANTHYYKVATFDTADGQSLEWKEFEIDRSCTRDGNYIRLYWLNQMGRIDGFNFDLIPDDEIEVTKSTYEKLLGVLTATTFTYNTHQQESSTFHSRVKQKYKLRSTFLTNEESQWLKELIASTYVLMVVPINSGNTFVGVQIEDSKYKTVNTLVKKLESLELNISLTTQSQRQRL